MVGWAVQTTAGYETAGTVSVNLIRFECVGFAAARCPDCYHSRKILTWEADS